MLILSATLSNDVTSPDSLGAQRHNARIKPRAVDHDGPDPSKLYFSKTFHQRIPKTTLSEKVDMRRLQEMPGDNIVPMTDRDRTHIRHCHNQTFLDDPGQFSNGLRIVLDMFKNLNCDTTFEGGPDKEYSDAEQLMFHAKLPAAGADGKATMITYKLHLMLKNEW